MAGKLVNNSHCTAKERSKLSYPVSWLLENHLLCGRILDFGCGLGSDVKNLKSRGFDVIGYDKYYFPHKPSGKFDTIICSYVLNVLEQNEQPEVLMDVSELLVKSGKAYYAVRRDVYYEGFRIHKIHKKTTYQCHVKLPFKSIFENSFCEIYEYVPITSQSNVASNCPFCSPDMEDDFITEIASVYAVYDKFSVSDGHALVIPKRHVSNYFSLSIKEQQACLFVINRVKQILDREFSPDGYNVGINVDNAAGQTVPHVHIHVIPRYKGDVEDPTGGVRNVIPGKGNYLRE